ncbi:hypothetical protein Hanom_Chr13g01231541 [Helianthus anomalus]
MANKCNLNTSFNVLTQSGLDWYVETYQIPSSLRHVLPKRNTPIFPFTPGKIPLYTRVFDSAIIRSPSPGSDKSHNVSPSTHVPFRLAKVNHFDLLCRALGSDPNLDVFRAFYKLNRTGDWYTFKAIGLGDSDVSSLIYERI